MYTSPFHNTLLMQNYCAFVVSTQHGQQGLTGLARTGHMKGATTNQRTTLQVARMTTEINEMCWVFYP